MSVYEEFVQDCRERRGQLVHALKEQRVQIMELEAEAQKVEATIQAIDVILGGKALAPSSTARQIKRGPGANGSSKTETDQLRQLILDHVQAAYPEGRSTNQLAEEILPEWNHGKLTRSRIAVTGGFMVRDGQLARSSTGELFFVPTD